MKSLRFSPLVLGLTLGLLLCSGAAVAQDPIQLTITTEGLRETIESTELLLADPTLAPMVTPDVDDFDVPDPQVTGTAKATPMGINAYFEVSDKQKVGLLTPSYRLSQKLQLKARIPLILQRTMTYYDASAEGKGLGDISLDVNYSWWGHIKGRDLRTQLSVKLPTGDSQKMDGDYRVPLGTGSLDFVLSGQYVRKTPKWDLIGSALYRYNTVNSQTVQMIDSGDATHITTTENDIYNGNVFSLGAHGRRTLTGKWSAYLGATLYVAGNGKTEFETKDNQGATPTSGEFSNNQGMTLLDLMPGISYNLGVIKPYLGVRIPVLSSYKSDADKDNRDVSIVLQFSYKPGGGA